MNFRRGQKVTSGFAAIGFILPWLLLIFYAIARKIGAHPSTMLLLYVCPSSIMALGLDSASLILGLFGWLLISLSNAILYAMPGAAVGVMLGWGKSD